MSGRLVEVVGPIRLRFSEVKGTAKAEVQRHWSVLWRHSKVAQSWQDDHKLTEFQNETSRREEG